MRAMVKSEGEKQKTQKEEEHRSFFYPKTVLKAEKEVEGCKQPTEQSMCRKEIWSPSSVGKCWGWTETMVANRECRVWLKL